MFSIGKTVFLMVVVYGYLSNRSGAEVLRNGIVVLFLGPTTNGIIMELEQDGVFKLNGTIGVGIDFTNPEIRQGFNFTVDGVPNGFSIEWTTTNLSFQIYDCFDLQKGKLNWYGGPETDLPEWPIQKLQLNGDDAYIPRRLHNFAVPERYWLSSNGIFIYVDQRSPLFIDQNVIEDGKVCFIARNSGPYINRDRVYHHYHIIALDDPVSAHKYAINNFLGQPTSIPNVNLIKQPIWTTWAKYKKPINDSLVRQFAYDILDHGFGGQIEIDERWETCFGSRVFETEEFGNITAVVQDLKSKNLRVTLWAAPFVNPDCTDLVAEGEAKGYFVKNTNGNMSAVWWESDDARQIDFTNAGAGEWYSQKLRKLLENPGVDSFKFDAGEVDYVAQPAVYESEDPELFPNIFTQKYINTVAQFGDLLEVRSAFGTQNYSFLLRMIDKDSAWGLDNGLQSLIPTLLQLNLDGYSFVLPDMIGGNAYRALPTLEMLIRWTQANVFMPVMQFSFVPWEFADDTRLNGTEIFTSMIRLHEEYAQVILETMEAYLLTQTPVNPPIWWIAPTDEIALQTNDEYLLGENILVAPVLEEGATSRSVYLPNGTWIDGNNETISYTGPLSFVYDAPLSVLPYFIRQNV